MNKKFFVLLIMVASLLIIGLLAIPNANVLAQAGGPGCIDAAGAPVACTPTPEPTTNGSGSGSGGNQNPTRTPLPIVNPTQGVDTAAATWSGTCKGGTIPETTTCIGQFTNGCSHVGGSTSSTVNTDGSVDLTCTVPLILQPTPLSITNPTEGASTEAKEAICNGGTSEWRLTCALDFATACTTAGGESTIKTVGSTIEINCTKDAFFLVTEPTPFPIASGPQEDDLLGTCSQAQGDVLDCLEELQLQCEDGLLVIEVDLYAAGGTSYKVYCIPHKEVPLLNLPYRLPEDNGATEDNWGGGCNGGDGLDACLDLMSSACAEDGGDFSVWYDDDGAGVYCQNQSEAVLPASTPAPEIVPAPTDDGDGGGWLAWFTAFIGLIIGLLVPAVQKMTRKKKKGDKTVKDTIQIDSWQTKSQSKEHVLLINDDGGTEAGYMRLEDIKGESNNDSAGKPKPKPKPTPPPPPQPKPSGGLGDFNSDGDVDGSDFNP